MKQKWVLIAPNAFKHSLTADEAALAIQEGLQQSRLDCLCQCFPVGDGGDGTGDLLLKKLGGTLLTTAVHDPLGRPIQASYGLLDTSKTAVIEMTSASGLRLLKPDELNPLQTTSFGTGELIREALDRGVKRVLLAVGGSATVDGGMGILRSLGLRFVDASGRLLQTPDELVNLVTIDTSGLDPRVSSCAFTLLCDVDTALVGEQGAAAVFGPQKGATPAMVEKLNAGLDTLATVVQRQTGTDIAKMKYGGAAGGVAAGLHAFLRAELVNGIDFFLDFTGFDQAIASADILITGEGSLDEQTLHGKGPYGVAYRAKQKKMPVIGLAGRVPLEHDVRLAHYFDGVLAIGNEPTDLGAAFQHTKQNLTRTAHQLGNLLSASANW